MIIFYLILGVIAFLGFIALSVYVVAIGVSEGNKTWNDNVEEHLNKR